MTPADVSVVLCAYTEQRWNDLLAAVRSVREQSLAAREIIVAIDHNPQLLARVRQSIPDVIAVENTGGRGAGEARNCGVHLARSAIVAFLDDDAAAAPGWIEHAASAFEDPRVIGVGGTIEPAWDTEPPRWMPAEFYWTVGCTYAGLPTAPAPVRNLIATNMFVRRDALLALGGFRPGFGKTGVRSGTEETDLCIRANQRWPESIWLYDPAVAITHRVPESRSRLSYFVSRCYDEGVAKASIVGFLGGQDGLASEREYTARTLPRGFLNGLRTTLLGRDAAGIARSCSIALGFAATTTGYSPPERHDLRHATPATRRPHQTNPRRRAPGRGRRRVWHTLHQRREPLHPLCGARAGRAHTRLGDPDAQADPASALSRAGAGGRRDADRRGLPPGHARLRRGRLVLDSHHAGRAALPAPPATRGVVVAVVDGRRAPLLSAARPRRSSAGCPDHHRDPRDPGHRRGEDGTRALLRAPLRTVADEHGRRLRGALGVRSRGARQELCDRAAPGQGRAARALLALRGRRLHAAARGPRGRV